MGEEAEIESKCVVELAPGEFRRSVAGRETGRLPRRAAWGRRGVDHGGHALARFDPLTRSPPPEHRSVAMKQPRHASSRTSPFQRFLLAASLLALLASSGGCALWNEVSQPDNLVYGMDTSVTRLGEPVATGATDAAKGGEKAPDGKTPAGKPGERFLIHRDGWLVVVEIGTDGKIKRLDQQELVRREAPEAAKSAAK
jgi:hypothetical protein